MSREREYITKFIKPSFMSVASTSQQGNPVFRTGEGALVFKRVPLNVRDEPTIGEAQLHRDKMRKTPSGQEVW